MRAGTSKGIFLHRKDLPRNENEWAPSLISAMGSRGNDPRQVDGVGGGSSTTSKVAVISPSQRPGVDVDFTFVQVGVGKEVIDFTGTCGNITSGVGPFAVQEGLVKVKPGQSSVRILQFRYKNGNLILEQADVVIYNTNTNRIVIDTVEIDDSGDYKEDGDYMISGVKTSGSEVKCTFVDPVGSMTGTLFPSGHSQDVLRVKSPNTPDFDVRATLIDSANPFVLIDTTSIHNLWRNMSPEDQVIAAEAMRQHGAVAMGLASSLEEASRTRGTPKIAFISPPANESSQGKPSSDIRVQAYSMGLPHPSLQLTGAVTLAVALCSPGTIVAHLSKMTPCDDEMPPTPNRTPSPTSEVDQNLRKVRIAHSQGTIDVSVALKEDGGVRSCAVSRTARRLFEGKVRYYTDEE
jgi:2-methylaconitate cis-trans-isomerase PrpF